MDQARSGTVVIALRTKEGHVILASDTAITVGGDMKISGIKITNKKGILIGTDGVVYLSQLFKDDIEEVAEEIKNKESLNEKKFMIWESLVRVKNRSIELMGNNGQKEIPSENVSIDAILVLPHNGEIKILQMDPNGTIVEFPDFIAIGSCEKVFPLAKIFFKEPLKLENALRAVYLVLESISKTDPYVEGADIWIYTKEGEIKHLSQKEIEKIAKEANKLEKEIWKVVYAERERKTKTEKEFDIRERTSEERVSEEKLKPTPQKVIGS
jgi:ATP-dependent protease HslVU (ClpYQ) peptidase subunit